MRLLLILLLAAWIGVSIGCNKGESYKTREGDPAASDPAAVITDDPALSGAAPAGEAKPAEGSEAKPAEGSEAKPAEGSEAKPAEGSEAKPEEAAKKE